MKTETVGKVLSYLEKNMGISMNHAKMEDLVEIIDEANFSFSEYEEIVDFTAIYPNRGNNIVYPVVSLAEEVGEVSQILSKAIRDKNGVIDDEDKARFKKESGDVLWYLTALAKETGTTLEEIAQTNYEKLLDRAKRNKLNGSGDSR